MSEQLVGPPAAGEGGQPHRPAEAVSFYQDDGLRLDGDLYLTEGREPRVAIVFCHGWGGTRDVMAPLLASGLTRFLDCAVLTFDYSGWGSSAGRRGRLDPFQQVDDVRSAVSWMLSRFPHLAANLALWGISFGAGIATRAAALDARVRALAVLSAYAGGERLMRDQRPHWQFLEFVEKVEADRLSRAVGGTSAFVDPDTILVRDPEAAAFNRKLIEESPSRRFELDLVSADRILEFDVIGFAERLRDRPSLFVHAERDLLIPWQHSEDLAETAGGRLMVVPEIGHYDFYSGDPLGLLLSSTAEHFGQILAR